MKNSVVHFELAAKDMERAKKFYSEVFGWEMDDMPGMDYAIARTVDVDENRMPVENGAINGGIMPLEQSHVSTVIVLNVEDIDAHMEKIKAAGGEVVAEVAIVGDMGKYARVKDTEGNIIGVWQNIAM